MAGGVSTLGTFLIQTTSINQSRQQLDTLQRQIATGKKANIFASLGDQVQEVQRLRSDVKILDSYSKSIDRASVRTSVMNTAMTEMNDFAVELRNALTDIPKNSSDPDFEYVQELARSNLPYMNQLLNTEVNGRYVFSGSETSVKPVQDLPRLNASVSEQLDAWFDGSQTIEQAIEGINGLGGEDLGYNLDLNTASKLEVRVDDARDIDYTVLANEQGFADLLKVTATLANMEFPDPDNPLVSATTEEFYTMIEDLSSTLDGSLDRLNKTQSRLVIATTNMERARTQHETDSTALKALIDNIENIDPAEVITKLRQVETQLNASYQSISTLSDLTLTNFL